MSRTVNSSTGVYSVRMLIRTPAISMRPPSTAISTTNVATMMASPPVTRRAKTRCDDAGARVTRLALARTKVPINSAP